MVSKFKERNIVLVSCVNFEIFAIPTIFLRILDIPSSLVGYSTGPYDITISQVRVKNFCNICIINFDFFNETRVGFCD